MKIDFIDYAKGYAIFTIVLYHYLTPLVQGDLAQIIKAGGAGVHLFFLVSGFGLALSAKSLDLSSFYLRRFSKILIPYYVVLLIIVFINQMINIYPANDHYALGGHFFAYKMFDERIIGSYGEHFWFISTLIQFYVLYPAIIWIYKKSAGSVFLISSFLISFLYVLAIYFNGLSETRVFGSNFLVFLWEFNLGIYWGDKYKKNQFEFWKQSKLLLLSLFSICLVMNFFLIKNLPVMGSKINDIFVMIGYLSLSILIFNIQIMKAFFLRISSISYELYLVHIAVMLIMFKLFSTVSLQLNLIFSVMLSILAAYFLKKSLHLVK